MADDRLVAAVVEVGDRVVSAAERTADVAAAARDAADRAAGHAAGGVARTVELHERIEVLSADLARRCPTPPEVAHVRVRPWFAATVGVFALVGVALLVGAIWHACRAGWPLALAGFSDGDAMDGRRRRADGGTPNPEPRPAPPRPPPPPRPDPDRDPVVPEQVPPEFYRWINCNGSPREDPRLCPSLRKRRINP